MSSPVVYHISDSSQTASRPRGASVLNKVPVGPDTEIPAAPPRASRPSHADLYNHEQEFFLKNQLKLEAELSDFEKEKHRQAQEELERDPGPPEQEEFPSPEQEKLAAQDEEIQGSLAEDLVLQQEAASVNEQEEESADDVEVHHTNSWASVEEKSEEMVEHVPGFASLEESPPPPPDELHPLEEVGEVQPLPCHTLTRAIKHKQFELNLSGLPLTRVAVEMEKCLFTTDSISRAASWMPSKRNSVIVAHANNSGESIVSRMVRLLGCDKYDFAARDEILDVLEQPSTAVWLESALVDNDELCLHREQPGEFSLYKTMMTHQMIAPKMARCPNTKVIVLLRHPLDVRLAYKELLRSFYVQHQTTMFPQFQDEERWLEEFPDDEEELLALPITLVQLTKHHIMDRSMVSSSGGNNEYERNIQDWINDESALGNPNCLILFYEELISNPSAVLFKLGEFLGKKAGEDYHAEQILRELTEKKKRQSLFAHALQEFDDIPTIDTFTRRAVLRTEMMWKDVFQTDVRRAHCLSYEELYIRLVGSPYPLTLVGDDQASVVKSNNLTTRLMKLFSLNKPHSHLQEEHMQEETEPECDVFGRLVSVPHSPLHQNIKPARSSTLPRFSDLQAHGNNHDAQRLHRVFSNHVVVETPPTQREAFSTEQRENPRPSLLRRLSVLGKRGGKG